MQTTIKIQGMSCGHCEGKVNAELGKLSGVSEVKAVAADGIAIITSADTLNVDEVLRAVSAAGYQVLA